jgi:WD40 repeat protein
MARLSKRSDGSRESSEQRNSNSTTLRGQTDPVVSAAFSPDGTLLATGAARFSGTDPAAITIWDVATGSARTKLKGPNSEIGSLAFSPDGKRLAAGGGSSVRPADAGFVKLWETAAWGEMTFTGRHEGAALSLAFAADGKALASGSADGTVKIWEVESAPRLRHTLGGHSAWVGALAFAPDGRRLVSGGTNLFARNGSLKLWDPATGKEQADFHASPDMITQAVFAHDGSTIATGYFDGRIKLLDAVTGRELANLAGPIVGDPDGHTLAATSVAFSPDGKTLATGGADKVVKLWDVAAGKVRATLKDHTEPVGYVAFSAQGASLVSASRNALTLAGSGEVIVWDVATGRRQSTLPHQENRVVGLALAPDGKTLAVSMARDREMTRKQLQQLDSSDGPKSVEAISDIFSSDVALWDVATARVRDSLRAPASASTEVSCLAFAPDGSALAAGTPTGALVIWDLARRVPISSPNKFQHSIFAVAFSHDSRTVATFGVDKTLRLWQAATCAELIGLDLDVSEDPRISLAFSPDGRTLAAGSMNRAGHSGQIQLWRTATD